MQRYVSYDMYPCIIDTLYGAVGTNQINAMRQLLTGVMQGIHEHLNRIEAAPLFDVNSGHPFADGYQLAKQCLKENDENVITYYFAKDNI